MAPKTSNSDKNQASSHTAPREGRCSWDEGIGEGKRGSKTGERMSRQEENPWPGDASYSLVILYSTLADMFPFAHVYWDLYQ